MYNKIKILMRLQLAIIYVHKLFSKNWNIQAINIEIKYINVACVMLRMRDMRTLSWWCLTRLYGQEIIHQIFFSNDVFDLKLVF